MSQLLETIKIDGGIIYNSEYHSERFNKTRRDLFGIGIQVDLRDKIIIPAYARKGLFKCRIEYNDHIRKIEFIPYEIKPVRTLRLVEAEEITYDYKFLDRSGINNLLDKRMECDDILIVKNGRITDTSYANIVVRGNGNTWYTPSTYLLNGTRRKSLLDKGIIKEKEITPASLKKFRELHLINSMIDIGDTSGIPVRTICF